MKRILFPLICLVVLTVGPSVFGQVRDGSNGSGSYLEAKGTGLEVENPRLMRVVIEDLSKATTSTGLTAEKIRARTEHKLKQAGLQIDKRPDPYLHITIHVDGAGHAIHFNLMRFVQFYANSVLYQKHAATWQMSVIGTHEKDPEHILKNLDRDLDEFLLSYKSANAVHFGSEVPK